ncbi:MAG TPA: ACP S-malonyltransferase [Chitinophaga sp.]|uniref:ACP S-malonyltransferase n=1 Tax=Chitinophaga sp. TaxID=1869181 RepID=UPI002C9FD62F|nr:ACP S-malonyltransferase [Chitinophaga sp.]HVI46504.1 ACP S-malonyltransferase [Chitinophaga sp.]
MKAFLFPGQGSQTRGMGEKLLAKYAHLTESASNIMGYDMGLLCVKDPERLLNQTQFTQPALYLTNALTYLDKTEKEPEPDCVLGHSLGEYVALFAAGAYSFETGLRLVKKRGELMARVKNGTMAAVLGLTIEQVGQILLQQLPALDIANYNSARQIVITGPLEEITSARKIFTAEGASLYYPLNVSGAFHSRYMKPLADEFSTYLESFSFSPLRIPVIANATARRYTDNTVGDMLVRQLTHQVKWYESISRLIHQGCRTFCEAGPGDVLTKMQHFIEEAPMPASDAVIETGVEAMKTTIPVDHNTRSRGLAGNDNGKEVSFTGRIRPEQLGSAAYRKDYNVKFAYVTGAMVHGIASRKLVVKMGQAGMIGYFGTGGMRKDDIEAAIIDIQRQLSKGEAYGMNLLNGSREHDMVDLLLKHKVRNVEAAAYLTISPELVRLRLKGLTRNLDGSVHIPGRIMAKISRPEVAEAFLTPPPEKIVESLLAENIITTEEAALGKLIPMADDICVEADSGGHTDQGVSFALIPTIMRQRDNCMKKYRYSRYVRVGAAGGIGVPEAAAAAFILGADFILTGSINQCTVESGMSDIVKDMLQDINVQDTTYAPAGDMFEIGAKVQVLKKGVFFPARANKLYDLYRYHNSLDDIDEAIKIQIQEKYFKRTFAEIYKDVESYYSPGELQHAIHNPKQRMAYIFRWYFGYTNRLAIKGVAECRTDFQVHTGPALGAFNQWVKGTPLENWRNRHVDEIALKILTDAADILSSRLNAFTHE